jgi:uncharacterized protein
MNTINQRTRFFILIIYLLLLLGISYLLYGSFIPPTSEQGIWFYSCLASIVLGDLLVSPYFTKPADAIANAIAAIIVLLSANSISLNLPGFSIFLWSAALGFNLFVLIVSIINITTRVSEDSIWIKISRSCFVISTTLGTPRWAFSTLIFFSLVTFHANNPKEYVVISVAWFTLIAFHPLEYGYRLLQKLKTIWVEFSSNVIGDIVGYHFPGIILIKQRAEISIAFGETILVRSDGGKNSLAVALDQVGFTDTLWQRALCMPHCKETPKLLSNQNLESSKIVSRIDIDNLLHPNLSNLLGEIRQTLVGVVSPETDIAKLRIEFVRTDLDIEEGRLVKVNIGETPVLYQIVNGLTKEEIVEQKNSRGYVRGEARKLGRWNSNMFEPIKWVPQPNSPVYLVDIADHRFNINSIGFIPFTDYDVKIDLNYLVTHNTAIIGILGVGKTCLALELIERMIYQKIKVVCLDLTDQYIDELEPYYPAEQEVDNIYKLHEIGRQGRNLVQQNVEEGGSIQNFKEEILNQLRIFLDPNNEEFLRIYNPTQYEVWKQDSRPYQDRASMATLTPCEITRIITEACLYILQNQGMSPNVARCCLVFEEAHSIVPEWNSVANDGDRTAANGTAKAILQGRKYGLGGMVITQRTANVTKSILNQCNTIFALRSYDATGIEFLKNFIGDDYNGVLTTLEDRHSIVFGKASSCQTPVIVRLNEREEIISKFRKL